MKACFFLLFCLLLVLPLAGETSISANISTSQTWTLAGSPYIITNSISVGGSATPVLTIEAGVEVRLNGGVSISIGTPYSTQGGAIVSNGTEAEPVVFTANSDTPVPGFWDCLQTLAYAHVASTFTHTAFAYGGSSTGMFNVNNLQPDFAPSFDHCVFSHSSHQGLYHISTNAAIGASVSNCVFKNNAGYPLQANANQAYKLGAGNSYTGNVQNRILLRDVIISTPQTWLDQGVPYEAENDLQVRMGAGGLLQIMEGTEIRFGGGHSLIVGYTSNSFHGGLVATGATFSGCDGMDWNGIQFQPYITASSLDNCTVRDVVSTATGAVWLRNTNFAVSITDCEICCNDSYGLHANDNAPFSLSGTDFQNNYLCVSVAARDLHKLGPGNTYQLNTDNRVHCRGGIVYESALWTNQGTPVLVQTGINLRFSAAGYLTLPWGTILEFASNTSFSVGYTSNSYTGAVSATGVTFRGESPSAGHWQGLLFEYYGGSSLLSGCTIRDAGYGDVAGVRFKVPAATMTGCQVLNCLAVGIRYETSQTQVALTGNSISGCGSYPLSLPANCVRAIGEGNDFSGNNLPECDRVEVRHETVNVSCTWIDPGVPYLLTGTMGIYGSGNIHLKILPGTVLYLPADGTLTVGYTSASFFGSLEAEGVIFTSVPGGGISYGLFFNPYLTHALCVLEGCVFENLRDASHNTAVYVNNSFPSFLGCSFQNNAGSGIAGSDLARFTLTDCDFINNGSHPVRTSAKAFEAVSGTGNFFSGNTPNRIQITGGTLDQNYVWGNPSVPVEVTSSINVWSGAGCLLKIISGLTLLFTESTGLSVGYTSNSYKGSLQADGATFSALNGTAGGWAGITLNPYLYEAPSGYIRNCVVEYAGSNVYFGNSAFPLLESCVIRHGSNYGIRVYGANSQPSLIRNYIQGNPVGIHCSNGANPLIGGSSGDGNSFSGNTDYAVQNTSTAFSVNARYNWWGHETGPAHSGNPGGSGDPVSDHVDYGDWRDTDIGDAPARFHLLSPADLTVLETLEPVLDWEEAIDPSPGDVVTYTLEIAENSGFTLGLITITPLSASVYHLPAAVLEDDSRYYWRVKATDLQEQVTLCYENYWWFDTAVPEAPQAFDPLSPAYNATVHFTSNLLSWEEAVDPDPGDLVTYTIYQDISAGFENAQTFTTDATQIYSGFCAPGSLIYWKVKATDLTDRSTYSPTWRFFVHPDAKPRAPVDFTLTPSGNDILISWDVVPGADSYDIYFSSDPYSGFSLLQSGLSSPSCPHSGAANQPRYFYYVIAQDTQ